MCSSYHEGHGKSKHYCRIIPIAAFFLLYLAIFPDSSYNTDKQMACRSSRPEYDERVCLTSESDGVPSSAEYRLHVRRNLPQRVVPFLNHISNFTSPHHFLILQGCVHQMKLVTIHCSLLEKYRKDPEVLFKSNRPYVLVIRLKYKGQSHDFAVPVHSNIPASAPKHQYFSLPPRPTTRPHNHHGLHYIKMFPVTKSYLVRYRTEGNSFALLIQHIINKNSRQIVSECQKYLDDYSAGNHPAYSTDIDLLLSLLHEK